MTDFAALRRNMVDSQVAPNDVTDRRLLRAMAEVPREAFVSEAQKPVAYIDEAIKLGNGRLLLPPMIVGKMLQLARIEPADTVLEIGCATGYASAVMARLAANVVALESDSGLAVRARAALGGTKVKVVEGPLEAGHAAEGPYDVIILSGSVPEVPQRLAAQLAQNGRLVAIVGDSVPARIAVFTRTGNGLSGRELYDASICPLPGFERAPVFVF
jgi:protein-L-isoaspartate(D-aspartate) O-methyltransferase